jgi:hypothetical protein
MAIGVAVGAVVGAVALGLLGYAQTAGSGWEDLTAVVTAMMGFVGGAVVGAVLGLLYGRYFAGGLPLH